MKKMLLVLGLLPMLSMAQMSNKKDNNKKVKVAAENTIADAFTVSGTITGFPDNTTIELMNPNTGAPEASSKIVNGKFTLTGKMTAPDFRVLVVNSQPPYFNIFLDNSAVKISASKENFEGAEISGSRSHDDFVAFNKIAQPYEQLFADPGSMTEANISKAGKEMEAFISQHPDSYITPLAIYRYHQITSDGDKLESMYNQLPAPIQQASIGAYLATLIKENKKFPIGKPMPDFSQADADGKMVSLSSLRGKYVLVDFWASWCGPCRQENPNIVATYNKYKDKNFTVLGVSLDKSKEPWLQAINADGLTWMHVSDLKGWNNEVAQRFEIFSIPQSILLDPAGNIVGKNLRGPALEAKLATLIK